MTKETWRGPEDQGLTILRKKSFDRGLVLIMKLRRKDPGEKTRWVNKTRIESGWNPVGVSSKEPGPS